MKPLISDEHDAAALQELGRASVQVVHDLKNQINGLKLYATFLRKRMEAGSGRADELETVNKILAGLERAAADMSALVRFGRPVELRRAPRTDLAQTLAAALACPTAGSVDGGAAKEANGGADGAANGAADAAVAGDFDPAALTEALQALDAGARGASANAPPPAVALRRETTAAGAFAVIEWTAAQLAGPNGADPFSPLAGSAGLRLALAAKIIRAHDGTVAYDGQTLRVRLPLGA